ncbi:WD40/YVTN/BNR-like repeat-containing protein [Lysobacter brunescens]|uniref:WD40/YVTN/BNR-like repeat-containing protein n=1 Tax=Lysobacter brunescens TaxID=262323 RepID=A0ABW2Y6E2_9GAMM
MCPMRFIGCAAVLAWMAGTADAALSFEHDPELPATVTVLNPDLAGITASADGTLLVWGSDASLWRYDAASPDVAEKGAWQPAQTFHDRRIRAVAEASDRTAGASLVAVGDGGLLLHSADGGRRWNHALVHTTSGASRLAPERDLAAVACDLRRCLAVGPQDTLLHSIDGGAQWHGIAAEAGMPDRPQGAFTTVVLTTDGSAWVGGADGRLWQDAGPDSAWRERRLPAADNATMPAIDALAADDGGVLLAMADGRLLALSADASKSSTAASVYRSARGSFTRFSPLPAPGGWVATGSAGACAWREASGASWRDCGALPERFLRGAASSPDGRHWVLAGEGGLLLHGRPPDRAWRAVQLPALDSRPDLEAVAWSDALRGFVAVGPGGLVLHGSADGATWTVAHDAPRLYVHDVVSPKGDSALLAALSHRTLARSEDGGRHWRSHTFTQLHEPAYLFALHADRAIGSVVVGGGQGAVMVAPDGEHWRTHSTGHGREHLGLLPLPGTPVVLLHGSGGQLTRVHGGLGEWHDVPLPSPDPVYGSFTGPDGRPWLVGGGLGEQAKGTVQRGSRDGTQWALQTLGSDVLRTGGPTPDRRALLLAGDGGVVLRTELPNDGTIAPPDDETPPAAPDWVAVAQPLPDAAWSWLQHDAAGEAVWLGGSVGALIRSTDGGLHWHAVDVPTTAALRRPTWDPQRRAWWMPGRDGTLLRSDDDGRSWRAVFTHTREHLKGVWVDPADGALLLYGARLVRLMPADTP